MANILTSYTEIERFYLADENRAAIKIKKPIEWRDEGIDVARNMQYHGTLTFVTNELSFYGDAKSYIEQAWQNKGILANIRLIRQKLRDQEGEVKFVQDPILYADFHKMRIKGNKLTIPFNSNTLMDVIDSHEQDEFEIETTESIDKKIIPEFPEMFIKLDGRSIQQTGEFKNAVPSFANPKRISISTEVISEGNTRHSRASIESFSSGWNNLTAAALFYDNLDSISADTNIKINYNISTIRWGRVNNGGTTADLFLRIYKVRYVSSSATYIPVESGTVLEYLSVPKNTSKYEENVTGVLEFDLTWEDGLVLVAESNDLSSFFFNNLKSNFIINDVEYFEPSVNLNFTMVYDVFERIMIILTGRKNSFSSNFFGRKEKGYKEDGEGALIGLISGLWVRAFDRDSEKYKSPIFSLKGLKDSCVFTFNLGAGVEKVKLEERFVIEDLQYFYRNEVVGRFPFQITNEERYVDESSCYSSLAFGYEKGGDYENEMGLDEPNTRSKWTTMVHDTRNKWERLSSVRADETELERLRRKPQENYPNENLQGDNDNWFLDLKRNEDNEEVFEQVSWEDRLEEEPQGIHSPETFRSMLFTPLRILFRNAKNFNSGMYKFRDRFLKFASNAANRTLKMKFLGEENSFLESQDIQIDSIDNAIFKNEKLKFTHPMNEEVRELIFGKTKVTINGEEKMVPNFYFKYEWLNEKNEIERGYFLKMENSDNPIFEFQIANEDII